MIGYIRVSDSRKADGESQREVIRAYTTKRGIQISDWVEEHVSATMPHYPKSLSLFSS